MYILNVVFFSLSILVLSVCLFSPPLCRTNFSSDLHLSFTKRNPVTELLFFQEPQFKNKIIGENDITLQCVDQLYGGRSAWLITVFISTKAVFHLVLLIQFCLSFLWRLKFNKVDSIRSSTSSHVTFPRLSRVLAVTVFKHESNPMSWFARCYIEMHKRII